MDNYQSRRLLEAAVELLSVATLRGDNDLPHPADDPKLWTSRMSEAWSELEAAVEDASPRAIDAEIQIGRRQEKRLA